MEKIIYLSSIIFLLNCQDRKKDFSEKKYVMVNPQNKLEILYSLPQDSIFDYYDLSNDFLMKFPDLSGYTIRSLNLSYNYIDTLVWSFLPQGLEKLNLSHNYFREFPEIIKSQNLLKELNLSYNHLQSFVLISPIFRLDISNNNLQYIRFSWNNWFHFYTGKQPERINYLNISHNPKLSNRVWFSPSFIDTIIHNNIANDKKLEMINWHPLPDID